MFVQRTKGLSQYDDHFQAVFKHLKWEDIDFPYCPEYAEQSSQASDAGRSVNQNEIDFCMLNF